MESFIGATPKSGALPWVWKKFKAYAEFLFNGPLKEQIREGEVQLSHDLG